MTDRCKASAEHAPELSELRLDEVPGAGFARPARPAAAGTDFPPAVEDGSGGTIVVSG